MEFAWYEADLLDHAVYDEWLTLWTDDARYIVPIEPGTTDFENSLNYAYDDHSMRKKRVERLLSGQSISASPVALTVRSLSRFRTAAAPTRPPASCAARRSSPNSVAAASGPTPATSCSSWCGASPG